MRKLAEAIGYSPASLYLHFESRDEIARALGREGFAQLLAQLEPLGAIDDPRERLHALAHAYVAFGCAHQQAYRLMYREPEEGGRAGAHGATRATVATVTPAEHELPCEEAARMADLFADALEALAATGNWRHGARGDSALLARALWAMLHGVVALSQLGPGFAHEASLTLIVDAALDGWLGASAAKNGDAAAQHNAPPPPARTAKKTPDCPS